MITPNPPQPISPQPRDARAKAIDFGRLSIDRVIIHDVPIAPDPLVLSDVESNLDDALRNYFAERLRRSLMKGFDVERDPGTGSITPTLVQQVIRGQVDVVQASSRLAQHLYGIQRRPNSSGLLVIATATLEGRPALALLKLERGRGMRAEQASDAQGRRTFQLDVIRSLLFTDHTQVFKASLFRLVKGALAGKVSDEQAMFGPHDIAHFFLTTFLGCRLATAPEVSTRDFLDAAQSFINDSVADAVTKTTYELALLTELNSQRALIEPRTFATAYLRVNDRQPFLRHLEARGVTSEPMVKSLDLVASTLKRVQIDFDSGVKVLARPELLEKDGPVTIEKINDRITRVSITDELTRLRSSG